MRIDIVGSGAREDWIALWGEAFPEDDPAWIAWYADNFAASDSILGAWDGIRLVGTVHMNRCSLAFGGREIPSCAVAGVATARDLRGRGIARNMLEETHRILRERGIPLAYLYPFSYPFYEKFGWQAGYRARMWNLSADAFSTCVGDFSWVDSPCAADFARMADIYGSWSARYDGYRIRSAAYMEKLRQDAASDGCRLGLWCCGDARGYVLAAAGPEGLSVHDWAGDDMTGMMVCAARSCGAAAVSWTSPDDGTLRVPGARTDVTDRDMVRILDYAALLDGMVCAAEGVLSVGVEDAFLPENGGIYRLASREGRLTCVRGGGVPDVSGDIRAWTRFWMGYASAEDTGLVFGTEDKEHVAALLAAMRPPKCMWLREMYV